MKPKLKTFNLKPFIVNNKLKTNSFNRRGVQTGLKKTFKTISCY